MGVPQVPRATMAPVVSPGHQAVLALKDLKDFRARRVSVVPLERAWWAPPVPLGSPETEGSRGGRDQLAPVARREKLR